jgi:hypothetical protein
MAKYAVLQTFYASSRWRKLRDVIIAERDPMCAKCGKVIADPLDCELDHIHDLTPENVTDTTISLNPDNIQILCHSCHDQKHNRFGHQSEHGVFLIYGPPLSGKVTYVKTHMQHGDLVVDMDRLYSAVSMLPEYDKPIGLLRNVLGLRNLLIDNIKTRNGKWNSAWVIGGYPEKYKREQLANDIGAELIYCEASKEECTARLSIDLDRQCRKDEWVGYITKWFENYVA